MKKALALILLLPLLSLPVAEPAGAASPSFTIYANSGSANAEEGCFTTSADPHCNGSSNGNVSVTKGDTVSITFKVPADDPYCCGAQVTGDGGQFDTGNIAVGGSKKITFTANSSFNFTSYWPNNSLVKAHGSVTVNAPAPQPPATPKGLKATALSTSQIRLTWNAAQGATSYKVRRDGATVATVSGTEFTNGGLQANTMYSYRVVAVNSDGSSAPSSPVSAKTHAKQPSGSTNDTDTDNDDPDDQEDEENKKKLFIDERGYYAEIDGKSYGFDNLPDIGQGQVLVLYGKTAAKAKIAVAVDGTKVAIATADGDGRWSAEVPTEELSLEQHEAVITMSDNGVSAKKRLQFTVREIAAAMDDQQNTTGYETLADTVPEEEPAPVWPYVAGATFAGVALAGGGLYKFRLRRKPSLPASVPTQPPTTVQPGDIVRPDGHDTRDL